MLDNIHQLAWSVRIFYVCLILATLVNLAATFAPRLKSHWRFCFGYAAVLLGLYSTYVILRLAGALDFNDYRVLVNWLLPLLVFIMINPVMLILWESKFYEQAKTRQLLEVEGECRPSQ